MSFWNFMQFSALSTVENNNADYLLLANLSVFNLWNNLWGSTTKT